MAGGAWEEHRSDRMVLQPGQWDKYLQKPVLILATKVFWVPSTIYPNAEGSCFWADLLLITISDSPFSTSKSCEL